MKSTETASPHFGVLLRERVRRLGLTRVFSGALMVGLMTIIVKLVAFLKEIFVAQRFGTTDEVEVFILAVSIPAALAVSFGGAFHDSLVPAYASKRLENSVQARRIVSNTLWVSLVGLILISTLGVLFRDPLINLIGGQFSEAKKSKSSVLFILLVPYMIAVTLSHILKGYLRSHDQFLISSLAPVLVPLSVIGTLLLHPNPLDGNLLAIGTSTGAVLCFLVLLLNAKPRAVIHRPLPDRETGKIISMAMPLLASATIFEFFTVVDTVMAATLPSGSVAILSYGERLSGVFILGGSAVISALLPKISDAVAARDWLALRRISAALVGAVVSVSAALLLFFAFGSNWLVSLFYERGRFTSTDSANVGAVLQCAAFQIPAYILAVLGAKIVTSLGRTRFILVVTIISLLLNVILNIVLMQWIGVKGIALSTAIVQFISALSFFTLAVRLVRLLEHETAA